MLAVRSNFEEAGGRFLVHEQPSRLMDGVWLTGFVPRTHAERNWSGSRRVLLNGPDGESSEDTLTESLSLVIDTPKGLVVVSGCGHAGLKNILDHATQFTGVDKVHAALGGFHLFNTSEADLASTANKMRQVGVEHFMGAHCTGIEAVYRLRELVPWNRSMSPNSRALSHAGHRCNKVAVRPPAYPSARPARCGRRLEYLDMTSSLRLASAQNHLETLATNLWSRGLVELERSTAIVGAVGASFTLNEGLEPLSIAK